VVLFNTCSVRERLNTNFIRESDRFATRTAQTRRRRNGLRRAARRRDAFRQKSRR
jgi:hypothetical protein